MEPRSRHTAEHERVAALRSALRDLRSTIGDLEGAVPRLESALSRRAVSGFTGNGHHAVQSGLADLKTNVAGLRDAVPTIERALHSQQPGVRSPLPSDLADYIADIRRRLEALRFVVPRLEQALTPGARPASDAVASAREAFAPLQGRVEEAGAQAGELTPVFDDLRGRVHALEDMVPRLEKALVAGVDEITIPEVWEPVLVPLPRPAPYTAPALEPAWASPMRAPWWSRARLKGLALATAALVMLVAFGTAWYFNPAYQQQRFAKSTVFRMQNAPSYQAVGVDLITTAEGRTVEIREQFEYVNPDEVSTVYLTGGDSAVQCRNKNIIVRGSSRYQRCNDPDAPDFLRQWVADQFDATVFQSTLFQPWIRFAWCTTFTEGASMITINGIRNHVYSCQVPNVREAETIWARDTRGEYELSLKDSQQREKFLAEGRVDIVVYVRETDGYIGRFTVKKVSPSLSGATGMDTETVDYTYTDFGEIEAIAAPNTSASSATVGGSGASTDGSSSGGGNTSTGSGSSGGSSQPQTPEEELFDSSDDPLTGV